MLTQTAIKAESPAIERIGGQQTGQKASAKAAKAFSAILSSLSGKRNTAASGAEFNAARAKSEPGAKAKRAAAELDAKAAKDASSLAVLDRANRDRLAAESAKKSGIALKGGNAIASTDASIREAEPEGRYPRKKNGLTESRAPLSIAHAQIDPKAQKPLTHDAHEAKLGKLDAEPGRNQIKVNVTDLRMKAKADSRRPDAESARDKPYAPVGPADAKLFQNAMPEHGLSADQAARPTDVQPEPMASPQSQAIGLAARLQEDGASDIVRAAQVVLRDGEMGLIRLRLEPQTLGGVKIELKLTEKLISGRIVVESDLAADAFRSSLDALRDAFAEAGFETASLEVEVRGEGQGGAQSEGRDDSKPYWSAGFRELDKAVPELVKAETQSGLNLIV